MSAVLKPPPDLDLAPYEEEGDTSDMATLVRAQSDTKLQGALEVQPIVDGHADDAEAPPKK